ncbi:hypothetical protein TNCV_4122081 [Trichonephila clavipes]|nr:hypothetical protein TNCV_4122081 [Trichonephila clavipes]
MRKSVYDKINHVQLFALNTTLRGFSNSKVRLFGYFKDYIQIDELKCNVEICVVDDDAMLFDVIIGLNVLRTVGMTTLVLKEVPPRQNNISCHKRKYIDRPGLERSAAPANDISCHKMKNLDCPGLETSATPANDNSCLKKVYLHHPGLIRNTVSSTKNS